jgi:hypothetical protein
MSRYRLKASLRPDWTAGGRELPSFDMIEDPEGKWMKADDVVELLRDCFPHVPGQLKDRIADLGIIEFENDQE